MTETVIKMDKMYKVAIPQLLSFSQAVRSQKPRFCSRSLSYNSRPCRFVQLRTKHVLEKRTSAVQNIHICTLSSIGNRRFIEKTSRKRVLTEEEKRKIEQEVDKVTSEVSEIDKNNEEKNAIDVDVNDMAKGLVGICENYSKAHGTYVAWETDVNLSPPKAWGKPAPVGDKFLQDYFTSLQYSLYETGHPETIDRSFKPRKHLNKERVNIALLSSPVECIGILLEGGKQLPDGFHLVLSPSWFSKEPSEEDPSLSSLYLHKSISFHFNGASFIDEFDPPRRVTYLVNYFTDTVTSGQRNDGIEVERNLDCPMSSSVKLCALVDDKVWTRDIMAEVGMEIPETLAFRRIPARELSSENSKLRTVNFENISSLDMNTIEKEITAFSERLQLSNIRKIVVKPSGPKYLGSVGISLHRTSHVSSIVKAAKELLMEIDESCSVLVEEFVEHLVPLDSGDKRTPLWSVDETLGFRLRSTVCRDHDDTPVTTLLNCAVGDKTKPINGDNSVCQSLDSTLLAYNIFDRAARQQLDLEIRTLSAEVLRMIIEKEKLLSVEERGAFRGQTDVIGIDMVVTKKKGKLVPFGIEVNSHDCTINTQLYDFMMNLCETMLVHQNTGTKLPTHTLPCSPFGTNESALNIKRDNAHISSLPYPSKMEENSARCDVNIQESRYYCGEYVGQSVRPLVRNMISRSQRYVMKGKEIIVIGGGGFSKRNIWPDAAGYGLKITLVDSNPNHIAREQVERFIHYDFDDHKKDLAHACNIFNLLLTVGVQVDGCLTFWEDCVPLAALVSEMIGTQGSNYKAALVGKKKSRTQNVIRTRKADIPHWPRTYLYSSKSVHIDSNNDTILMPKSIEFPAILKLEHGSSAIGVSVVKNEEELKNRYHEISESLRVESDFPGIGLGHDNTMTAMEFHTGSEHDVDVIMYDRKLVGAFISDNGPTRRPYFTETAAVMPSSLPVDKQAQLITAAYQCCTEIGLSDGTFNVELLMTKSGPKLIEINARMGGFYLRDWIRRIYGVDLMLLSCMIASGIKPYVPKHPPDIHLMGVMLIPSVHSHVLSEKHFRNKLNELIEKEEIVFTQLGEESEMPTGEYEEPIANIAVSASTSQEAKSKLLRVCKDFEIDQESYQLDQFLKYF